MLFLTQRAPGHSESGPEIHLDLVEANRRQLLDAGLRAKAIQMVGGCTSCQPEWFYSHRASQGHAGRMMAVIGILRQPADIADPLELADPLAITRWPQRFTLRRG